MRIASKAFQRPAEVWMKSWKFLTDGERKSEISLISVPAKVDSGCTREERLASSPSIERE